MRKNRGFTLFELLAVLAIIAIVATIAIPRVMKTISASKEQSMLQSMKNIANSLERFSMEQEIKSGSVCQLSSIEYSGAEWHQSNINNRGDELTKALDQYISDDIKISIDIKLNFQEQDFLTPPSHGCISIWYPSINENNERVYQGNIKPTGFNLPVYTYDEWDLYTNKKNNTPVAFLFDIDGDGPDDSEDFIIYNSYFQLNTAHKHAGQNLNVIKKSFDGYKYFGTLKDDKIIGNANNNRMYGRAGNDIIDGGIGNSDYAVFETGSWTDYHLSGNNPYVIIGPEGTDTLVNIERLKFPDLSYIHINNFKNEKSKVIQGNDDNDKLTGNSSENTLYGKGGNDTLNGEGGNDVLVGGAGDDVLNGGSGTDKAVYHNFWVYYEMKQGSNILSGLEGKDTLNSIEKLKFKTYEYSIEDFTSKKSTFINGTENSETYEGTVGEDFFVASKGVDTFNTTSKDTIIVAGFKKDYTIRYDITSKQYCIDDNKGNIIYFSAHVTTRVYFYDSYSQYS